MTFFSVLNDIRRNKNNFKEWEKQEKDDDARREELYKNGVGHTRYEKQKQQGELIIDVITRMDQHSENVAEDVEMATQSFKLPAIFVTNILTIISSLWYCGKQMKKAEKVFNDLKNDERFLNFESFHTNEKTTVAKQTNLKQGMEFQKELVKKISPYLAKSAIFSVGMSALGYLVATVASSLFSLKAQIAGSRVARWQSREALKDEKNFVIYTDEQKAQAKENLKKKKLEEADKGKEGLGGFFRKKQSNVEDRGLIKNTKSVLADYSKYKEWKKTQDDSKDLVTRDLTEDEIAQAKADQQQIQRIVKKINNTAEIYSENMETAATVILGSSLLGGFLVDKGVDWFIEKTQILKPIVNTIRKNFDEETLKKIKELESKPKMSLKDKTKVFHLTFEQLLMNKKRGIFNNLKAMIVAIGPKRIASKGCFVLTGLAGAIIALIMQKNAARAGRHQAREEFKKNPQEFVSYTQEELDSVKHIEHKPESLGTRFKNYIMFLPRCIKQMREYKKFKKTEYKEQQELMEELKKLDCTEEQLKNARNTQKMIFNTFEKVDENSQVYSETMEAANELVQETVLSYGPILAMFAPFGLAAAAVAKGKLSAAQIGDWATWALSKFSWLGKTKMMKRLFVDAGDNIADSVKKVELNSVKQQANEKTKQVFNIADSIRNDIRKEAIGIVKPVDAEVAGSLKQFQDYLTKPVDAEVAGSLRQLSNDLENALNGEKSVVKPCIKKLLKFGSENETTQQLLVDCLQKHCADKKVMGIVSVGKFDKAYLQRNFAKLEKIIDILPEKEVKTFFDKVSQAIKDDPSKFFKLLKDGPNAFTNAFLNTPTIKKLLLSGFLTWGLITTLCTYMIASFFAKLELQAGRLGVMKSFEELDDYRYYAPAEAVGTAAESVNASTPPFGAKIESQKVTKTPSLPIAQNDISQNPIIKKMLNKQSA